MLTILLIKYYVSNTTYSTQFVLPVADLSAAATDLVMCARDPG